MKALDLSRYASPALGEHLTELTELPFAGRRNRWWLLGLLLVWGLLAGVLRDAAWPWMLGALGLVTFVGVELYLTASLWWLGLHQSRHLLGLLDEMLHLGRAAAEDLAALGEGRAVAPTPAELVGGVADVVLAPLLTRPPRGLLGRPFRWLLRWRSESVAMSSRRWR